MKLTVLVAICLVCTLSVDVIHGYSPRGKQRPWKESSDNWNSAEDSHPTDSTDIFEGLGDSSTDEQYDDDRDLDGDNMFLTDDSVGDYDWSGFDFDDSGDFDGEMLTADYDENYDGNSDSDYWDDIFDEDDLDPDDYYQDEENYSSGSAGPSPMSGCPPCPPCMLNWTSTPPPSTPYTTTDSSTTTEDGQRKEEGEGKRKEAGTERNKKEKPAIDWRAIFANPASKRASRTSSEVNRIWKLVGMGD